jgi:hypothetical protein
MADDEDLDKLRTAKEVAQRTIALHCAIAAAHGVSKANITEWLKEQNLWSALSPREMSFIESESNDEKSIIRMTWKVEALVPLLWAIKKLDRMNDMTTVSNTGPLVGAIPALFSDTGGYISSASLRKEKETRDEYERIYDSHCEVRSAMRHGSPAYRGINPHVIFERHYGFNWLIGYLGQAWDVVTPDT